jgi:uncharacterized membrane protein
LNESLSFIIGIMGLTWVLILTATAFTPYFMRKNICFGISIPEREYDNPKIKSLRRNYSISCFVIGLILGIGSTAFYIWVPAERAIWIQLGGIFLYIVISNFIYFFMRSEIKAMKQSSDWEIDTETVPEIGERSDKTIGTAWYLLYLVPIAIAVFAAVLKYPSLPGQIPMHYNIAGEVDRYAAKSIGTFAVMPLIQLLLGLMFAGMNFGIGMSGHQRNFRRTQAFQGIMSIYLFVIGFMVMLMFTCIQLTMVSIINEKLMMVLPVVLLVVIFAICIFLGVKVGQGGSRLETRGDAPINKVDDDRYWLGGFLYCNKDDPSLFVEKRFGMGYTLNFGNLKSFIAIAVFVVLILAITVLPFLLGV